MNLSARPFFIMLATTVCLITSTIHAGIPTIDGLYYGDPDSTGPLVPDSNNYYFLRAADGARGSVFYNLSGDTLYILMLVDGSVNDNVFGIRSQGQNKPDGAYLESSGWETGAPTHQAEDLIASDHLQVSVICGDSSWTWRQDYLWDADNDSDPYESDWLSDPSGPDAAAEPGNPPAGLFATASSMQWNMNYSYWDVTLGGHRSPTDTEIWKSADDYWDPATGISGDSTVVNNSYNTWDDTWKWEWPMVYEMGIDLSLCGPDPIIITVISAHNSPVKDQGDGGDEMENVPVDSTYLVDYGDAPSAFYPTVLADDGARHYIVINGPRLGSIVDAEDDGQPNATTMGDDIEDGTDDEDGVVFTSPLNPGDTAYVDVMATAPGYLNAWIDFHGNGWEPGDHIFSDTPLSAGTTSLPFAVPVDANIGDVYARFRFGTDTGLSYTGPATDGEVEDYLIGITVPVELHSFGASYSTGGVLLSWETASEEDNLGFNIYRSTAENAHYDLVNEELIPGAGTSTTPRRYIYLDTEVQTNTTYYYFLGDLSVNGVEKRNGPVTIETTSEMVVLDLDSPYPHPVKKSASMRFSIPVAGNTSLSIYDLSGRQRLRILDEYMEAGNHIISWNPIGSDLGIGSYIMRLITTSGVVSKKIVIVE